MSEEQVRKCSKCGSDSIDKKNLRIPGSFGFWNPLEVTAYICNKCATSSFIADRLNAE